MLYLPLSFYLFRSSLLSNEPKQNIAAMWTLFVQFRSQIQRLTTTDLISEYGRMGIQLTLKTKEFPLIEQRNNQRPECFDNRENFYLKLIDILKRYLSSNTRKSLLQFSFEYIDKHNLDAQTLRKLRTDNLNDLITRLEVWRRSSEEFQLILGILFLNQRKYLKLYLKIRGQMLKYKGDKMREEHYLVISKLRQVKMHNLNKYDKREIMLEQEMVNIELWAVLASKILEGTPYHTTKNKEKVLHFIRQAEVKQHRADTLMKIKSTTMLMLGMCILKNMDSLFTETKQQQVRQIKINPESPRQLEKSNTMTAFRDKFVTGLVSSKVQRRQSSPLWQRRPEIQDIILQTPEQENKLMSSPRAERAKMDYSYRLTTHKPANEKKYISDLDNRMSMTTRASDPILESIRRSMKMRSRQLNQSFNIMW